MSRASLQYILGVAQGAALTFWSIDANDQTPYYDWIVAVSNDANPPLVQSVSYGDVQNDYSQVGGCACVHAAITSSV